MLNSRICAEDRTTLTFASVSTKDARFRKLFPSYSDKDIYLLKKYATDQAVAKYDAAILCFMQSAWMIFQQCENNLVTKLCRVVDTFDERSI